MEIKEAIKNIKEHCYFNGLAPGVKEALDMAIKALEKDTPKAPKKSDTPRYGMGYDYYDWCCPSCGKFLAYECDSEREKIHHCRCGQRLKWEEGEK